MSIRKILFINPPFAIYGGVEGHGGKNAPLNLAYLASYLREKMSNIEVSIIDAEGLELTFSQIYKKINDITPDIIGITTPTAAYYNVQKIVKDIKEIDKKIKIVLGGSHPTALPYETLSETECDAVVIGEGELTFYELVKSWQKNIDLSQITGLAYKKGKEIIINKKRELIKDLDTIPLPAKDLLPLDKYFLPPTKRIRSERATNMITSRGCPFNCNFCMAESMWERKVRLRSVKNVLEEITLNVENYNLDEFSFHDEVFTFKKDRVREICSGILKKGLDITWVCMARAGSVDLETLKIMKKAGCGKIGFGFESGSERILNLMCKKSKLEYAFESVKLCKKAGIEVFGAFILGYPGENIESIKKTINFAIRLGCDTVAFFIAIPYPGTNLWYSAVKNGYLKKEINWMEFAPVSNLESPMIIPGLSPDELQKWKKRAFYRFYLRPQYILKRLTKLRSTSDIIDIIRGMKIFKNVT